MTGLDFKAFKVMKYPVYGISSRSFLDMKSLSLVIHSQDSFVWESSYHPVVKAKFTPSQTVKY